MPPAWIAVDWGTTHLRAWAIARDGAVLAEGQSDKGMGALARDDFEPALLALIAEWLDADRKTPVIACGMVGARQGWVEAPYRAVPCAPLAAELQTAPCADPRITVRIVPGLMQDAPADVMRGEETQIGGLLAETPGFDGTVCLPGTHTKWATVRGGEVTGFRTEMTGEMFSLLEKQSVLRHSLARPGFDDDMFEQTIRNVLEKPASTSLFSVRADDLLHEASTATSRARLSAMLIGSEIAGMSDRLSGSEVVLVGASGLVRLYETALRIAGVATRIADGTAITLKGLAAVRAILKENS